MDKWFLDKAKEAQNNWWSKNFLETLSFVPIVKSRTYGAASFNWKNTQCTSLSFCVNRRCRRGKSFCLDEKWHVGKLLENYFRFTVLLFKGHSCDQILFCFHFPQGKNVRWKGWKSNDIEKLFFITIMCIIKSISKWCSMLLHSIDFLKISSLRLALSFHNHDSGLKSFKLKSTSQFIELECILLL